MPKLGMRPLRRRQLATATVRTISRHGLAAATVTRIAKTAGVAPGIVHHYFSTKDELLFEAMRQMLRALNRETVNGLAACKTPFERLEAVIDASLAPSQLDNDARTAWLSLYASARHDSGLARLLNLYYRRLHSNLVHSLKQLIAGEQAYYLAETIAALIDGVWLRCALQPGQGSPACQAGLVKHCLHCLLGGAHD